MYTTDKIQKQVNPQRHSFYRQIFFFIFLFLLALQPNARYGLLIHEVFLDHTQPTQHSRQDSSGRAIRWSQKLLPDNTQHSQQINFHAPVIFELTISAGERPQTYALDRAATRTGLQAELRNLNTNLNKLNKNKKIKTHLNSISI